MMLGTPRCDLLGIDVPIFAASMGFLTGPGRGEERRWPVVRESLEDAWRILARLAIEG
jgi:hypothetical protein